MSIGIVTDSTADLPPEMIAALSIHVVPNIIVIDGKSLQDGQDITREEFYSRLSKSKEPVTTAAPASGAYQVLYEKLLNFGYSHIVSIHASSTLSGIFNVASVAAQGFGSRITVVDSKQVTLGAGFQVLAAAEAALQGLSVQAILEKIFDVQRRVRVIAMLDTLEYVRRSGRVSWARARIGGILDIKPFVLVQHGKVSSLGETRTRHKGMERLLDLLHDQGPLERLAILHSNAESDARNFLNRLKVAISNTPFLVNVTTVIGTHVGPNGLGFAALPYKA